MNVAIDINHPGHVHFFKHFIKWLKSNGHNVIITSSNKNVSEYLLNYYNFNFIRLTPLPNGILFKILTLLKNYFELFSIFKKNKPDIAFGIASFRYTHLSALFKFKSYIFDDTEHSKFEILLYKHFAYKIYTPLFFKREINNKQIKYFGTHDYFYLNSSLFVPDENVLLKYNLNINEKYVVLRFISWNAGHDIGQNGFSIEGKRKLIKILSSKYKILISTEKKIEDEFADFQLKINPEDMHHILAYASLLIGESGTMTTEAACLGTYSICVNSLVDTIGVFDFFKNNNLMSFYKNESEMFEVIDAIIENENLKQESLILSEELEQKVGNLSLLLNNIIQTHENNYN